MENKYAKQVIIFLIVAIFVACNGFEYNKKLVDIDSLTVSNPNSALNAIEKIATEANKFSKRDQMYYQLLKIKANDKAYIEHKSDSIINDLVEYFEHNDKEKLPEVYYYAASVYRDLNDAPQSISYFQKAIEVLPENNHKLRSNCYNQMGILYTLQHLPENAIYMLKQSYKCDSLLKDTNAMADCLRGIANAIGLKGDNKELRDSVFDYYGKALNLAEQNGNIFLAKIISSTMASVYYKISDSSSLRRYVAKLDSLSSIYPEERDLLDLCDTKADLMMSEEKYDSARIYFKYVIENGDVYFKQNAYKEMYKICATENNHNEALKYLSLYDEYTDSITNIRATEVTARMHHLYNYQLRERENERLKAESLYRRNLIILLVAASLIILLAFLLYRNKARQERNTLQQKLARLDQFEKAQREQSEEEMRRNNERVDELERRLKETEGKNEETIKQLEAERNELKIAIQSVQLEKAKHDILRSKIFSSETYAMVKNRLDDGKSLSVGDIKNVDECINGICDGFRNTLYSSYKLSRQEYSICLLVKLELNVKEISQLLSRSSSAITLSRKRLFMKLFGREGTANELDTYILSL